MPLYGLEISEDAGILSSEHRQRQQETVCWEQLIWKPVQLTWETKQTTDAFATDGPGLLQAESLPCNCWSEYFVLHLPMCEYYLQCRGHTGTGNSDCQDVVGNQNSLYPISE